MLRRLMPLLLICCLTATAQTHIHPAAIASHIHFLASDALEGRETGMRGFEIAAEYVRAQFQSIGLQPVNGDWFQHFALRAATLDETQSSLAINGKPLVIRKDFLMRPDFSRENVSVDAPLVVAGFGVTAPELHRDDYAGIDARGKIVVVVSGAPKSFPSDQRAYYSSGDVKRHNAAAHGVVGMLTITTMTDEARNPFTDPSIDGAKLTRDWLRTIYHSPKDDLSQTFDFASGARYAETNLRLVRAIAKAPSRPSWTPGDFFGEMFGRDGRKATITLR